MKVKFLVPEIDRERFCKNLSYKRKTNKIDLKEFKRIGLEQNIESMISQYCHGKKFPTMCMFLSICKVLNTPPDYLLAANPEWVECDVEDISKFSVLGKFNDTYYIVPSKGECAFLYEAKFNGKEKYFFSKDNELKEELNPKVFSDLSIYGTRYDLGQERRDGIVTYDYPAINEQKTSDKVFSLLSDYDLSEEQVQKLLSLSHESIVNRIDAKYNHWTIRDLFKLSWILNMPFEDFLVFDESDEQIDSFYDDDLFLEQNEEWFPPNEDDCFNQEDNV